MTLWLSFIIGVVVGGFLGIFAHFIFALTDEYDKIIEGVKDVS